MAKLKFKAPEKVHPIKAIPKLVGNQYPKFLFAFWVLQTIATGIYLYVR